MVHIFLALAVRIVLFNTNACEKIQGTDIIGFQGKKPQINYIVMQCGKRLLANLPKASGYFGWRVRSTFYSLIWRVTVVRRVGT